MTREAGAATRGRTRSTWAWAWIACACASSGGAGPGAPGAPAASPPATGASVTSARGEPIPDAVARLEGKALAAERSGHPKDALALRAEAVRAAEKAGRPRLAAVLLDRAGALLEAGGGVQHAVVMYESGLRALEGEKDLDLSVLMRELPQTTKSYETPRYAPAPVDLYPEVFDSDLERAERDPAIAVRLLVNSGNAYARQPQENVALDRYERALARPEMADVPEVRARVLANSGEIRRRRGELDRAQADLDAARIWMEANAQPVERRRVLALLAGIQRDRGDLGDAEATFGAALALYARAGDPRGEGRALAGRGRVRLLRRAWAEARDDFAAAVARGLDPEDGELLWQAYWGLGVARRELGELDAAADALRESLRRIGAWREGLATDEGKVTFVEGARGVADELVDVHLARAARGTRGAWTDVLAIVEEARARALSDLMSKAARSPWRFGVPAANAPAPSLVGGCSRRLRASPSRRGELAPGVPSEDFASPARQMAPGVARPSPRAPRPAPPRLARAKAVAAKPLARLVFHVTPAHAVVLAVAPDGAVTGAVRPFGEADLEKRVETLLAALGLRGPSRGVMALHEPEVGGASPGPGAETLLADLYRDLVQPVAGGLPASEAPLVIEPHGVLWLVPFAALRAPDGTSMIDRWPLLYAPSAALLQEIRASPRLGGSPATWPALIVGNPLDAPLSTREGNTTFEFDVLPGAAKEANAVAALFTGAPPDLRIGARAVLDGVVERIQEFAIIHLATHGVALAGDPLASFLVFGDSPCGRFLSARDVASFDLDADLVVLSACQTGLGRVSGDGVIGLARSFLVAGARSVIVSLWNVDDRRTAELMVAFYREYLAGEGDKASALRRAMRTVRARGEGDPRAWAPFLLIGADR